MAMQNDIHWKLYEDGELVAVGTWVHHGFKILGEPCPDLQPESAGHGIKVRTRCRQEQVLIWNVYQEPDLDDWESKTLSLFGDPAP